MPELSECPQDALPGEPPERDDDVRVLQDLELAHEVGQAVVAFLGVGAIVRRSATVDRCDVDAAELGPVVSGYGDWARCEAGPVEGGEQEVTGPIAREDAAGAVAAVRRRGKPDDDDARGGYAPPGYRPGPVTLSGETPRRIVGGVLAVLDQARAQTTVDDLVPKLGQGDRPLAQVDARTPLRPLRRPRSCLRCSADSKSRSGSLGMTCSSTLPPRRT